MPFIPLKWDKGLTMPAFLFLAYSHSLSYSPTLHTRTHMCVHACLHISRGIFWINSGLQWKGALLLPHFPAPRHTCLHTYSEDPPNTDSRCFCAPSADLLQANTGHTFCSLFTFLGENKVFIHSPREGGGMVWRDTPASIHYLTTKMYIYPTFQNTKVHCEYKEAHETISVITVVVNGWDVRIKGKKEVSC